MKAKEKLRAQEIAVFIEVGGTRIDVTDLFFQDFAIVDELRGRLGALIRNEKQISPRGVAAEAIHTAKDMLDLITSRTINLIERVAMRTEGEWRVNPDGRCQATGISSGCARVRQLGPAATRRDLLSLGMYRRDTYAAMDSEELRQRVGRGHWTEICMRLATGQPVDHKQARRAAEWFLRGLDIEQAVRKARMKTRHRGI